MTSLEPSALEVVIALVERFETTNALSQEDLRSLKDRRSELFLKFISTGQTYNEVSGGPGFLSLPEPEMRAYLKSIDNDLAKQASIVDESFTAYLDRGEIPAPYYAWRIAIILRRAGCERLELRFLAAWCKHFDSKGGGRYAKLAARYSKLASTSRC